MTLPIDDHLFVVTLIITIGFQLTCFFIAYSLKFDLITDLSAGINFVVLAILSFVWGGHNDPAGYTTRRIVITAIVAASRLELGAFLFYRVVSRGKDARFDEMREKFLNFLGFWIFQIIWVHGLSLGIIFVNTQPMLHDDYNGVEIAGAIIAAIGFNIAFFSDVQKFRFRANKANNGLACTTGLWSVSRHPNYFGEIMGWWGVFVMCVPVIQKSHQNDGWVALLAPLLTMLFLLLVSGLPTCEGQEQGKYMKTPQAAEAYAKYRERTSIVLPLPPSLYVRLPRCVKIMLFDLPMFEYKADKSLLQQAAPVV